MFALGRFARFAGAALSGPRRGPRGCRYGGPRRASRPPSPPRVWPSTERPRLLVTTTATLTAVPMGPPVGLGEAEARARARVARAPTGAPMAADGGTRRGLGN